MRILMQTQDPDTEKQYRAAAQTLGIQQLCVLHSGSQVLERLFRDPFEMLIVDDAEHQTSWIRMKDKPYCAAIVLLFQDAGRIRVLPESVTYAFSRAHQPIDVLHTAESFDIGARPVHGTEAIISKRLQQTGVPVHMKGFLLLKNAIRLLLSINRPTQVRMMEDVYEVLAKYMRLNVSIVEHAMRHAIETAFLRADVRDLESMFGYTINSDRAVPSNAGFIYLLTDRIRAECKGGLL